MSSLRHIAGEGKRNWTGKSRKRLTGSKFFSLQPSEGTIGKEDEHELRWSCGSRSGEIGEIRKQVGQQISWKTWGRGVFSDG